MKVMDVIQLLEKEGTWIRSDFKTRDHLLHGSEDAQIHTVGVCWVATTQAIQEAARHKADMIITHENPFYQCSTQMHTAAYEAAKSKRRLLDQYGISVYRCHDVWDCIRTYGVADQWAALLGFPFEQRPQASYYQAADISEMRLEDLARHTCRVLHGDHEDGVYVFGNTDMHIRRIAIGTGAATDLYELLPLHPDAVIVSDDGITSYDAAQYALDHGIGMVGVNHAAVERAGLKAMVPWLQERMKDAEAVWLHDGFHIHYYMNKVGC